MSQPQRSVAATSLHQKSIVIDGHSDILIALTDGRMHLRDRVEVESPQTWQGAPYVRMPINNSPFFLSPYSIWYECMGQYDIPRWQEGGVTAQVMAIYMGEEHLHRPLERALDMTAAFHREIEANPDTLLLATTAADIRRAKAEGKTALLLSFEGGEPLGRNLTMLDIFYRLGLRMISLTHSRRNELADGTQLHIQTGGLTPLGHELIERMNTLGMVIDLAHLSDAGVWEVVERSKSPVIYSHTSIHDAPGYKTALSAIDPQHGTSKLRAVANKGGVACAIFFGQADANAIVDDIEMMIDHVGSDHVGIGTDFFSLAHIPSDLEDISRLPRLTEAMIERGFSDDTIEKVLGGNLLRVFEAVLG